MGWACYGSVALRLFWCSVRAARRLQSEHVLAEGSAHDPAAQSSRPPAGGGRHRRRERLALRRQHLTVNRMPGLRSGNRPTAQLLPTHRLRSAVGRALRSSFLRVRRFRCANTSCPHRIFAERLPSVVEPYARKTARLSEILELVGFALGGEAGARLAKRLGLKTSLSTLLRRLRRVDVSLPSAHGGRGGRLRLSERQEVRNNRC